MKHSVIIGVAESDIHVVANNLIEIRLEAQGYNVINLGCTTSIHEFVGEGRRCHNLLAIAIGSLNGHAYGDLSPLKDYHVRNQLPCSIILGGNLSIGKTKARELKDKFYALGVDYILDTIGQLSPVLNALKWAQKVVA